MFNPVLAISFSGGFAKGAGGLRVQRDGEAIIYMAAHLRMLVHELIMQFSLDADAGKTCSFMAHEARSNPTFDQFI
jgi:hypothetical protein